MIKNRLVVFITDDDEDDIEMIREEIEKHAGEKVIIKISNNGEELIDYLNSNDNLIPDLILLDLKMPKVDGIQVLKYVKGKKSLMSIPIIVLSNSSDEDDVDNSYLNGANSYVTKPTDYKDLVETIFKLEKFWMETAMLPRKKIDD